MVRSQAGGGDAGGECSDHGTTDLPGWVHDGPGGPQSFHRYAKHNTKSRNNPNVDTERPRYSDFVLNNHEISRQ